MSAPEAYIVDLPISPAAADVAGAPAGMIEHYVRCVGRPQDQGAFTLNAVSTGALASRDATIAELRTGWKYDAQCWREVEAQLTHRAEAAEARCAELLDALKPFAEYFDIARFDLDNHGNPLPDDLGMGWVYLTVGDFRRARALSASPNREGRDA